jgi:hypothetical protein
LIDSEIQQEKEENPSSFLSRLTEALQHHTKVDPETQDGTIILMTHFISQSALDIRRKPKMALRLHRLKF